MYYNEDRPEPTRGIIIVDTSALVTMSAPLDKTFYTKKARRSGKDIRLTNSLAFLSRYGFEIIVPEMVAFETNQTLRDGSSISDYFDRPCKPELSFNCNFLSKIPNLRSNIYIAPPPKLDDSLPADYMRRMWDIHMLPESLRRKRFLIAEVNREISKRKDFGDIAAKQILALSPPPQVPIFYLSSDREAITEIKHAQRDVDIGSLSVGKLYKALQRVDLWTTIGLVNLKYEEMMRHTLKSRNFVGHPAVRSNWDGTEDKIGNGIYPLLKDIRRELKESYQQAAEQVTNGTEPPAIAARPAPVNNTQLLENVS